MFFSTAQNKVTPLLHFIPDLQYRIPDPQCWQLLTKTNNNNIRAKFVLATFNYMQKRTTL